MVIKYSNIYSLYQNNHLNALYMSALGLISESVKT